MMRLSKSFVSEYIDIKDIDYKELAEKMVFAGNEYESIDAISNATGLVVGYVKSCKMHPDSKKLHICEVDLGDSVEQIICGAPNVAAGQKVIVAKVGAKFKMIKRMENKIKAFFVICLVHLMLVKGKK